MSMHVFRHHDGVIDDEANRDHHRQQGEQIDRKTHDPDQEQHGRQRERDGNDGNRHDPQGTKKEQDDKNNNDRCLNEGDRNALQGLADVDSQVRVHEYLKIGRQAGLQFLQLCFDPRCHLQRVCSRRLGYRYENSFLTARVDRGIIGGAGEFDVRDIRQAHAFVSLLSHHNVSEAVRGLDIGFSVDACANQRASSGAGGRNIVVSSQCPVDIRCGYAVGGHAGGVQPDTHREGTTTQDSCLTYALNGTQHGLDGAHRVVGALLDTHLIREQCKVHDRVITGSVRDDGILHLSWEFEAGLVYFGDNFGHDFRGIFPEADPD